MTRITNVRASNGGDRAGIRHVAYRSCCESCRVHVVCRRCRHAGACGGDDVDVAPTTTAAVVTTVPPVNETTTTVSFTGSGGSLCSDE